jgi:hypothetical protein
MATRIAIRVVVTAARTLAAGAVGLVVLPIFSYILGFVMRVALYILPLLLTIVAILLIFRCIGFIITGI